MQVLDHLVSMGFGFNWFQQDSASSFIVCFASDFDASHLNVPIEFHFVVIMFLCGFISHSFAILSKTMAMPNLFRATLLKERVVVRSPFMLCLSTQSTPLPNRRHWDDLRVSVWTLPLMTSVTARLLEQHELPL
jgi:hypothetical protein